MGVNISRNSAVESNNEHGSSNPNFCASCGQGLTTNQLSFRNSSQEANALESRKPQVDPAHGFHSTEDSWASEYTSGQVPKYSPYLMPTPSITSESEVKSWEIMSTPTSVKSVGASKENAKPIDDSHVHLLQSLHSQCLSISQSQNTVRLRTSLFSSS